jgi:ferritin-like metal-binding protein YciE
MYEGQMQATNMVMQAKMAADVRHNPTLAQNIEQRIAMLEDQVTRLKSVKEKLSTGSILDVPIDDLRFAMNY